MRIVVLGAGAMGCLFGGLLHHSGHEVTLVDVSPTQIEAINRDGLVLERDEGVLRIAIRAAYAREVDTVPDLLVVFTKTLHTAAALESAAGFIGDQTVVLTVQNGLGNAEVIEAFVPRGRIFQGVTTFPGDLVAPGHVRSLGSAYTKIMSADGVVTPRLEEVQRALDEAGLACEISADVAVFIWEKVAFNAALNALTAVTRLDVGPVGDAPEGRELAAQVVDEVISVAERKGIAARREAVTAAVAGAFAEHRGHKPSMLQDMLAGRITEVESLNGAVVREARALGMTVPTTETLYLLVRTLESAGARRLNERP
jgi:2-dehydropantoate 2-reductase